MSPIEQAQQQADLSAARSSRLLAAWRSRRVREYIRDIAADARERLRRWEEGSKAMGAGEAGPRGDDAG